MHHDALLQLVASNRSSARLAQLARATPIRSYLEHRKNVVRAVQAVPTEHTVKVLALVHHLGLRLPLSAVENAAYQLSRASQWRQLLKAVSLGISNSGTTSTRLLNWRIHALLKMQNYSFLTDILNEFKQHNLTPNRRSFHLLITASIRNHSLAHTKAFLAKMTEAGIPPDPTTHAIIAAHYRPFGLNLDVERHALQQLDKVTGTLATSALNSLLQVHLDADDLPGALRLLSFFEHTRIAPILQTFAPDNELPPQPPQPDHAHLPLLPDATTFAVFINYSTRTADLSAGLNLFNKMIDSGIQPTTYALISLINIHFVAGATNTAIRLVAEMCDQQRSPLEMFQPLMTPNEKWTVPFLTSGFRPSCGTFNALLKGTLQTRGVEATNHVLRIMHSNDVAPNAATLHILVSYLGRTMNATPATLFRVLRKLTSPTLRPSLRHLHVILSAMLRQEQYTRYGSGWKETAAARHNIVEPGVSDGPLSGTLSNLGPTAGLEVSHRQSKPLTQSLSDRRVHSDSPMFALRIKRDAVVKKDLSAAKDVFQTLLLRGLQANEYHFSALMQGYANAGHLPAALTVLTSAIQAGIKPNVLMFTILIVGYARQGKPQDAVRVFQDMVASNIEPDVPSIDALASAFFAVGAYATARRVLITMWPYIQPFPEEFRDLTLQELAVKFRRLQKTHSSVAIRLSKEKRIQLYKDLAILAKIYRSRANGEIKNKS